MARLTRRSVLRHSPPLVSVEARTKAITRRRVLPFGRLFLFLAGSLLLVALGLAALFENMLSENMLSEPRSPTLWEAISRLATIAFAPAAIAGWAA